MSLARRVPLSRGKPLARAALRAIRAGNPRETAPDPGDTPEGAADLAATSRIGRAMRRRRDTGFTSAVKLAIRARAGDGDPDRAVCEGCYKWLGRDGGQFQHRLARGMGGSASAIINSVQNGLLLCGTPRTGCHGLAESRHPRAYAAGLWLAAGDDPAWVPVYPHALAPGRPGEFRHLTRVWLLEDGTYGTEARR